MSLFSFQGKAYIAERDANGKPAALRWPFNVPTLQLSLSTTVKQHQESYTGQRIEDGRLITAKTAGITLELEDFNADNLALALYGSKSSVTGATVTAEALPDTLVSGDYAALEFANVSTLTITDSATSTPVDLVEGTDYVIESAAGGIIKFLNVASFTQPFNVNYTYGDASNVAMFTAPIPEKYIVFDGINTVDNSAARVRLYRCQFDPLSQLDLIGTDYGKMQLKGSVLYDTLNAKDPLLGGFGRIETPAAA